MSIESDVKADVVKLKTIFSEHLHKTITFGRRRPTAAQLATVPKFKTYATALPAPPATLDWSVKAMPCLSLVMLNDQLGDCTCAGACHCLGIFTGNAGQLFTCTNAQVLAMYENFGYVPGDPSTDQGADEVSVLNFLMQTGFPDGTQLTGYVAIDGTNQQEVQQAMWLAESLYFGVELPLAYTNPFPRANGFVWDTAAPDAEQGHCFIATGFNAQGVQIDTWGLLGTMTWAAVAALTAEEAGGQLYALFSEDSIVKATGLAPNGFDWPTLQADLQAMQQGNRGGLTA
jgi:hypothetical protein